MMPFVLLCLSVLYKKNIISALSMVKIIYYFKGVAQRTQKSLEVLPSSSLPTISKYMFIQLC